MSHQPVRLVFEDPKIYESVDPDQIFSSLLAELPPMLSLNEVCAFLRRDRKTVSEMIRSGEIPGVPQPPDGKRRKLIVPKISLIKYLVGCTNAIEKKDEGHE